MQPIVKATKVRFLEDRMWVQLDDGRIVGVPLQDYPRLRGASEDQRLDYEIRPLGIHWPSVDEDVSLIGIMRFANQLDTFSVDILRQCLYHGIETFFAPSLLNLGSAQDVLLARWTAEGLIRASDVSELRKADSEAPGAFAEAVGILELLPRGADIYAVTDKGRNALEIADAWRKAGLTQAVEDVPEKASAEAGQAERSAPAAILEG